MDWKETVCVPTGKTLPLSEPETWIALPPGQLSEKDGIEKLTIEFSPHISKSSGQLKTGASLSITPQTVNYLGQAQAFETNGYSATISDVRLMSTFTGIGINTAGAQASNVTTTTTLGTNVSSTVIGSQINLRATTVNTLFGSNSTLSTTLNP